VTSGALVTWDVPISVVHDLLVQAGAFVASPTFQPVVVGGNLTINGIFDPGSASVTVAGNVTVDGTLDALAASLTLNGTAMQTIDGSSSIRVGLLSVANPLGIVMGTDLTATTGVDLQAGWLSVGPWSLTIGGFLTGVTSGLIADGGSTLVISGTTPGLVLPPTITALGSLRVDNPNGVQLSAPLSIVTLLDLANGPLHAAGGAVTIEPGAAVIRGSGYVQGDLRRWVSAGSGLTLRFDVGDGPADAAVTLLFDEVTSGDYLVVRTVAGDHPDPWIPLVGSRGVNRYWVILNEGVVFTTYAVTLDWVAADVDPTADSTRFALAKLDGVWALAPVTARSATSITASGLTSFSEFAVGNEPVDLSVTLTADPARVTLGAPVDLLISVANAGPGTATGVAIVMPVPAGVSVTWATPSQGSCLVTGSDLVCSVGDLPAGAEVVIDVRLMPGSPATLDVTATVTTADSDGNGANDTVTVGVIVDPIVVPTPTPTPTPTSLPQPSPSAGSSEPASGRISPPDTDANGAIDAMRAGRSGLPLAIFALLVLSGVLFGASRAYRPRRHPRAIVRDESRSSPAIRTAGQSSETTRVPD
jgi:uncharacterized repeat protein (TIGR01451 family)